ncbi:MAG TPA: hypothetical protein P5234_15220 [Thermoanaerobaculaceae bacterium]|nr:hypothetical protein [Thermoanaerobaculaceae bacterium]HRS17585.1 hypothetical protein [Thermoanaerobaculaceae bacterium]
MRRSGTMLGWFAVGWLLTAMSAGGSSATVSDTLPLHRVRPRPGTYEEGVVVGGIERRFRLHLPPAYNHSTEFPVLVLLHDRGGDPRQVEAQSQFVAEAKRNGLILVVPWGEGTPAGWHADRDVAMLERVLDAVTARLVVDRSRLVLVGFGAGGTLALEAAGAIEDRLAVVVAVAAPSPATPPPPPEGGAGRVAVLFIAGTADRSVPYQDGSSGSQAALAAQWAARNGCDAAPRLQPLPDGGGYGQLFPGCRDGVDVMLVGVPDGGHAWPGGRAVPGGDAPPPWPSATELIVDFVTRHPKL